MYKMIVTDLDGTLLNFDRVLSEKAREYLQGLKNKGYIIVIATGRTFSSACRVTKNAIFANYLITDAGSATYKTDTKEILFQRVISHHDVESILKYWNSSFEYIDICDEDNYHKYLGPNTSLPNLKDISHISIKMKNDSLTDELFSSIERDFENLTMFVMRDSFKEGKSIEIVPKGVSKYAAVHELAEHLKIPNEQIISFGDSPNDLDMIKNCGFGVAMKNAVDEVKELADAITYKDYNEDGVIDFLKNIIK